MRKEQAPGVRSSRRVRTRQVGAHVFNDFFGTDNVKMPVAQRGSNALPTTPGLDSAARLARHRDPDPTRMPQTRLYCLTNEAALAGADIEDPPRSREVSANQPEIVL